MATRKRKKFLTFGEQCEVLKKLKAGYSNETIMRDYEISESLCYRLKEKHRVSKLLEKMTNNCELKNRKTSKMSTDKALDTAMLIWYQQVRDRGEAITGPILREKARDFSKKLNLSKSFKASNGWLYGFKRRYGIKIYETRDGKPINDSDSIKKFSEFLKQKINSENLSLENIYNSDESGIFWRPLMVSCNPAEEKEKEEISDRLTALFCANATGSHRIPLLTIGNSESPKCFDNLFIPELQQNRLKFFKSLNVIYTDQNQSFMNGHIFLLWYKDVFIPRVLEHQEKSHTTGKVILIVDNAPCHTNLEQLNAINKNFQVVHLPVNVTATTQPMNQGLISLTKKQFKNNFLRRASPNSQDIENFLKNFNLFNCLNLFSDTWDNLDSAALQKVWNPFLEDSSQDPLITNNPNKKKSKFLVDELSSFLQEIDDKLLLKLDLSAEKSKESLLKWFRSEDDDCGWEALSDNEILEYASKVQEEMEMRKNFVEIRSNFVENESEQSPENGTETSNPETFEVSVPFLECVKSEFVEVKNEIETIPKSSESKITLSEAFEGFRTFKKWMKSCDKFTQQHYDYLEEIEDIIRQKM